MGVGALSLLALAQLCPVRLGIVQGQSMTPTLASGSVFLYDREYYQHHALRPGDVVVIRQGTGFWIKRVYAAGGESFWILRDRQPDGLIRRDPISPDQVGRFVNFAAHERALFGVDLKVLRLRLPSGLVFVVGDGAFSEDSRVLGPFAQADVVGRVVTLPDSMPPDHVVRSFPKAQPQAQMRLREAGVGAV